MEKLVEAVGNGAAADIEDKDDGVAYAEDAVEHVDAADVDAACASTCAAAAAAAAAASAFFRAILAPTLSLPPPASSWFGEAGACVRMRGGMMPLHASEATAAVLSP